MENYVSDIFAKKEDPTNNQAQSPRSAVNPTKINVVGVGGGGGKVVIKMFNAGLPCVAVWLMKNNLQVFEFAQNSKKN